MTGCQGNGEQFALPACHRLPTPDPGSVLECCASHAITDLCRVSPRPVQRRDICPQPSQHVSQLTGQSAELETLGDSLVGPSYPRGMDSWRYAVAQTGVANLGDGLH